MERYYPLIRRYDTILVLYLPKTSRKAGKLDIIEPTNIQGVSNNVEVLQALRKFTRYQWFPDFVTSNGIIIESKGQMDSSFPRLVRAFRQQHPILFRNYRLAFENPNAYCPSQRKRVTYGDWATSMGIPWCHLRPMGRRQPPVLPEEWLHAKFVDSVKNDPNPTQFIFDLEDDDYEFVD